MTMELRKLENGYLKIPPKRVKYEGRLVFNPTEAILKALGYKPVRYTTMTVDPGIGYYWAPSWDETETEIVQVWKEEKIPEQPAGATDRLDEIFRILSGAE